MFFPSGKLYRIDQVPDHFKELFIESGYRSPRSSLVQCFLSIFKATNETLNFWTHFVPAVYFWYRFYVLWHECNLSNDPYMYPLLAYISCMCLFPLTSAIAHVLNCLSDQARHVCFFFDYAALSVFSMGTALAYKAYVFPDSWIKDSFIFDIFIPVSAFISVFSLGLSCETRFMLDSIWKKIFRFGAYALPYFFTSIPTIYRILSDPGAVPSDQILYLHLRQFFFGFLAALLYTTHLPERLSPGSFDIVGHSHQLFHVSTVLGCLDQLAAIVLEAKQRRESLQSIHPPRPIECMVLMMFVFVVCGGILTYFTKKLYTYQKEGKPMGRVPSVLDLIHAKGKKLR